MRTARRHVGPIAAALIGWSASLALAQPQQAQEPAAPRIRVAVEVIPVDVQVLARSGQPVPNLGPDKFTVSINGKRRRVASAAQIRTHGADSRGAIAGRTSPSAMPGRVIMLAVDCIR